MLGILTITAAFASKAGLLENLQHWAATDGGMIVIGVSTENSLAALKRVKMVDPGLNLKIAILNRQRPAKQEMKKAMAQLGSSCGLFISETNNEFKVKAYGICGLRDRKLKIEGTQSEWWVVDQKKKKVRALDYAILTRDIGLQSVLREEQDNAYKLHQGLVLSSGLTALSSFLPLVGLKEGFSSHTENRLWTSVFLLSTSAMLYYASATPMLAINENHLNVDKYLKRDRVSATISPKPIEEKVNKNASDKKEIEKQSPPQEKESKNPTEDPKQDKPNDEEEASQ